MKFMCILAAFFITGTIAGADFFSLFHTAEKMLAIRIFALPSEIRDYIFNIAKEQNKAAIKKHIQESLKINDHKQNLYNVEQYFAFRKYGTECTHVVAFYPKKGTEYDRGTRMRRGVLRVKGSSANIYFYTLKNESIETIDCIEEDRLKFTRIKFNGIELRQRDINSNNLYVNWHHQSDFTTSQIIEEDNSCIGYIVQSCAIQ